MPSVSATSIGPSAAKQPSPPPRERVQLEDGAKSEKTEAQAEQVVEQELRSSKLPPPKRTLAVA